MTNGELAELIALGISLGDKPSARQFRLALRYGYVGLDGSLTDKGWAAASDAIGFQE